MLVKTLLQHVKLILSSASLTTRDGLLEFKTYKKLEKSTIFATNIKRRKTWSDASAEAAHYVGNTVNEDRLHVYTKSLVDQNESITPLPTQASKTEASSATFSNNENYRNSYVEAKTTETEEVEIGEAQTELQAFVIWANKKPEENNSIRPETTITKIQQLSYGYNLGHGKAKTKSNTCVNYASDDYHW